MGERQTDRRGEAPISWETVGAGAHWQLWTDTELESFQPTPPTTSEGPVNLYHGLSFRTFISASVGRSLLPGNRVPSAAHLGQHMNSISTSWASETRRTTQRLSKGHPQVYNQRESATLFSATPSCTKSTTSRTRC